MTSPDTDADVLLPLRGGFAPRASVALWLIEASFRLQFQVVRGELQVRPRSAITAADDDFIKAHRDELAACIRYVDEQAVPA